MAQEMIVFVSGKSGEASRALQCLREQSAKVARNAVVLIRDRAGQVFIFESGDVEPRYGMLLGSVTGLLVELWGGTGPEYAATHTLGRGWSEERLAALPVDLEVDGSALVILVDVELQGTLDFLESFEGQVWRQALVDGLLAQSGTGLAPEGR
jgi:hypothetical protein